MDQALAFTPEQFKELLAAVRETRGANGLGAPAQVGLGCGDGGPLDAGIFTMLAAGSPRLALAKAWGVALYPYTINMRAMFANTNTFDIPDVGADTKIVQDTLVDSIVYTIQNRSATANQNQFQAQTDYYYALQSGIEAKLYIAGAPRPSIAQKFVPLKNLGDAFVGNSHWPGGWVLTYQQQPLMDFHASVQLPYAPLEVIVTLRTWTPVNEVFIEMSNRTAITELQKLGIPISDAYAQKVLASR